MKHLMLAAALSSLACTGSTGGHIVSFHAQAAGDPNVVSDGPLHFKTPVGFEVTLTHATLFVGALYFSQQNPHTYTLQTNCIQPGVYSGEVRGGVQVNLLSATPVPFPVQGNGTDVTTRAAELWLTGGDITAQVDKTVILNVAGSATRNETSFPFEGIFTISQNRAILPRNPALPGSNPLCRQRIVAPIPFETQLQQGATVTLWIDVRAYFASVDFTSLEKISSSPLLYHFQDSSSSSTQGDKSLYNALRSSIGPYRFTLTLP